VGEDFGVAAAGLLQGVGQDGEAGSWLSPWQQVAPGEVAGDVDRYSLPHGEEMAAVLIYVPGQEQPIDAGTA
jgi:hypothetical protein